MDDIPRQLRRLWGWCVISVLDSFASAKTDEDVYKELEEWSKLYKQLEDWSKLVVLLIVPIIN